MKLNEAAKKAELILIEGGKGSGKNTLASYFSDSFGEDGFVALITIPRQVYYKRQEIYKEMTGRSGYPFQEVFFLGEEWRALKKENGLRFFVNDIIKLVDTIKPKVLYIQRLDELFDISDPSVSFELVSEIARILLSKNIKLIISLLNPCDNYTSIKEALHNYIDLSLMIGSEDYVRGRMVHIISSFYPISSTSFHFSFNDNIFTLNEKKEEASIIEPSQHSTLPIPSVASMTPPKVDEKKTIDLIIISQQSYVVSWITYLFGNLPQVSLKFFRTPLELSDDMWHQADIIVLSADTVDDVVLFSKSSHIAHPDVLVFGWINQGYVRTEDRMKVHQVGCQDLFGPTTRLSDYILSLEKSVRKPFYSETINARVLSNTVDGSESFVDIIENALRYRRIFTVFIFRYTQAYRDEEMEPIFRNEDIAYLDEEHQMIYLLFMNAQNIDRDIVTKKLKSLKNDVIWERSIEAPELFTGKEVLFDHLFLSKESV